MNRVLWLLILLVVSASVVRSQSAYAKFDAKGHTIGLYKLLPDVTGCEASRTFAGSITKVNYDVRGSVYTYTFTVNSGGKKVSLNLIASDVEILQPDVDDIIFKNQRVKVTARQCGSSGVWSTEEVRRL
jgi:hypothetical protein